MYEFRRDRQDAMYTDYVIYSPDVPVIRDDNGELLRKPYLCTFITTPAVNAKIVLNRDASRQTEIREAMRIWIAKVLSVAALHQSNSLVLGAWGCGAFGNRSEEMADLFHTVLTGEFQTVFCRTIFANTDWSEDKRFIGPF